MAIYIALAITLLFALSSILLLWRSSGKRLSASWQGQLLAISAGLFIYLYGTWVFITIYAKYVFALVFIMVFVSGFFKPRQEGGGEPRVGVAVVTLFSAFLFLLLSTLYFTGTTGKPAGIANLEFPLKHGKYFVFQGGKGLPTNVFHYGLRGAVFAMDIIKLNSFGNRAKKIFSDRLEDYEIFNDTIYSPCTGIILKTENQNPDNIPPNHKRGPTNTNQVIIDEGTYYVFMGHLKMGSIMVKAGDVVKPGQPLGLAGNSGFSLEPHLHIQVHQKTNPALRWYEEKQIQIAFGGKTYFLFEEIK
jgi:hypothetical protein